MILDAADFRVLARLRVGNHLGGPEHPCERITSFRKRGGRARPKKHQHAAREYYGSSKNDESQREQQHVSSPGFAGRIFGLPRAVWSHALVKVDQEVLSAG